MCSECPRKLAEASPDSCTHEKVVRRLSKDQLGCLHLRPCLVSPWCWNYLSLLLTVRYLKASMSSALATLSRGKAKMNQWTLALPGWISKKAERWRQIIERKNNILHWIHRATTQFNHSVKVYFLWVKMHESARKQWQGWYIFITYLKW